MQRVFKHPQIFTDLLTLSQMYYPMHHNLPKPFRYAVGERIDHVDGMTVEEAEHQLATRLYQNTAKVHFNQFERARDPSGRRLVYLQCHNLCIQQTALSQH